MERCAFARSGKTARSARQIVRVVSLYAPGRRRRKLNDITIYQESTRRFAFCALILVSASVSAQGVITMHKLSASRANELV
jgi:hypothetical protein